MKQRYQNKVMKTIHEEAQALFEAGVINEERMEEYNNACLIPKPDKTRTKKNTSTSTGRTKPAALVYARSRKIDTGTQ